MKKKRHEPTYDIDQDEHFSFIAGYTPGGFPYGITWEEQAEIDRRERKELLPVESEEAEWMSISLEEGEDYKAEGKINIDEIDITELPF